MSQGIPHRWLNVSCLPSRFGRPTADDSFQLTSSQILMPCMTCSPLPYLIRVSLTNVSFWSPSTSPHLMKCHSRYIRPKLIRSSKIRTLLRAPRGSRRCYISPVLSLKAQERLCSLLARMPWNYTILWPSGLLSRTRQGRNCPPILPL
jgi:hypothetical protein